MEDGNEEYLPEDIEEALVTTQADHDAQTGTKHRRRSSTSVEGGADKRRAKRQLQESAGGRTDEPRFKRQKRPMNAAYLELLNQDIEDATLGVSLDDDEAPVPGQVGLTHWSTLEKTQLYEAVSRLGVSSLDAIAARVDTKDVLEVKHYLRFLQQTFEARQGQLRGKSKMLALAELPAAVELSNECCQAQEEAADAISLKQERHEQLRESAKWGGYWDITPNIAAALDKRTPGSDLPDFVFTPLFSLTDWLALSRRVFMNSTVPEGNWVNIDSSPPSIWATCLEDFHSLALSLTRRIMQTALYIASSRIRTQSSATPDMQMKVRARDVRAAVASLGLTRDSSKFWATAARRLRLNVHDDPVVDISDDATDPDILSYETVEDRLFSHDMPEPRASDARTASGRYTRGMSPAVDEASMDNDSDLEDDESSSSEVEDGKHGPFVEAEVKEGLQYSVSTIRDVTKFREALTLRVLAEREAEEVAEQVDARASAQAEAQMWKILEKTPSHPLPKLKRAVPIPRSSLRVSDLDASKDGWAEATQYYAPWETLQNHSIQSDSSDDDPGGGEGEEGEDEIDLLTTDEDMGTSSEGEGPL